MQDQNNTSGINGGIASLIEIHRQNMRAKPTLYPDYVRLLLPLASEKLRGIIDGSDVPIYTYANIKPKAKQSTRFSKKGFTYTKKDVSLFLQEALRQLKQNCTSETKLNCPVRVLFVFSFQKKNTKLSFKSTRPDLDNLEKPIQDCLSQFILEDDSLIVSKQSIKINTPVDFIFISIVPVVGLSI